MDNFLFLLFFLSGTIFSAQDDQPRLDEETELSIAVQVWLKSDCREDSESAGYKEAFLERFGSTINNSDVVEMVETNSSSTESCPLISSPKKEPSFLEYWCCAVCIRIKSQEGQRSEQQTGYGAIQEIKVKSKTLLKQVYNGLKESLKIKREEYWKLFISKKEPQIRRNTAKKCEQLGKTLAEVRHQVEGLERQEALAQYEENRQNRATSPLPTPPASPIQMESFCPTEMDSDSLVVNMHTRRLEEALGENSF